MKDLNKLPVTWAEKYAERIALIDFDGRTVAYKELYMEICRLTLLLEYKGVAKGHKVILQLQNSALFIECFFALNSIGAVPILCSMELGKRELNLAIEKLNPVIHITEETGKEHCFGDIVTVCRCELLTSSVLEDTHVKAAKEENYAAIIMSGGTTGIPRFIPMERKKLLLHLELSAKRSGINKDTRLLSVLPLVHKIGLYSPGVLSVLNAGGMVVLSNTKDFSILTDMAKIYKINYLLLVPSFAKLWLEEIGEKELQIDTLFSGGEHLDGETAGRVEHKFGGTLIQLYGMTEGVCFIADKGDSEKTRYYTQGEPISETDHYRIIDINGSVAKKGEIGELWFKGEYLFNGYLLDPEENMRSFSPDGYFKTGDLVKEDDDGNIIAVGRKREQINIAGEKMIPSELESYLLDIPEIVDCAVLGVPDHYTGERVCAVFVLKNDMELRVLRKIVRNKLDDIGISKYKYPTQIVVRNKLLYTRVGKIDKARLRKEILANEE
jgi:yersiniabactin salicyl-AMP ligase